MKKKKKTQKKKRLTWGNPFGWERIASQAGVANRNPNRKAENDLPRKALLKQREYLKSKKRVWPSRSSRRFSTKLVKANSPEKKNTTDQLR